MVSPIEQVILVDEGDQEIGTAEKLEAHRQGKLHRAFSVFLFNSKGQLMLQKRAETKYHSPNLWTNTCCSHPRPKEELVSAAHRRLQEEMGIDCELQEVFAFTYKIMLDHDLIEHEYDHVFFGKYDHPPHINLLEVGDWKWISLDNLKSDIFKSPALFTSWLKICLERVSSIQGFF